MHDPCHTVDPRALGRTRRLVLAAVVALVPSLLASAVAAQAPEPAARPRTPEEVQQAEQVVRDTLALAPDQPPSPDDVFANLVTARDAVTQASLARLVAADASAEAHRAAYAAALDLEAARRTADRATQALDRARTNLAEERNRLSQITVRAYVTGGDTSGQEMGALVYGDTSDPAHGRAVIFGQVLQRQEQVTDEARRATNAARKRLVQAREKRQAATARAAARAATARERARSLAEAVQAHKGALVEVVAATARLRSAPRGIVPEGVAIIGLPRLSAADLASWFAASPYRPRVLTPIEDYARWFIDEGAAEGIRGDIAFAQAVLETGGFANTDSVLANNFSGIGHCDLCPSGWTFPSPQMGVRAQIQLLKSYAVNQPDYVNDLVDRRLRGPAGCCQTWGDLTTVWATDPTYGPKVMLLYSAMVNHALARRAAGIGFEVPAPAAPAASEAAPAAPAA